MFILFLVRFGLLSGHLFWEKAAHSVDHMVSLYFDYLCNMLVISRFGFGGWIWVLIALVPNLCILFNFKKKRNKRKNNPITAISAIRCLRLKTRTIFENR